MMHTKHLQSGENGVVLIIRDIPERVENGPEILPAPNLLPNLRVPIPAVIHHRRSPVRVVASPRLT